MLPPLTLPDDGNEYGPDLLGSPVAIGPRAGLPAWRPVDTKAPIKLRMGRVQLTRGGLAPNGAYFRRPQPKWRLYHAQSVEEVSCRSDCATANLPNVSVARLFVWAEDRKAAKTVLRQILPNSTFYR